MAANPSSVPGTFRPFGLEKGIAFRQIFFAADAQDLADGSAPSLMALATGAWQFGLNDNLASALVFQEAANAYLTFVTTNSSEAVKIEKTLDLDAALDMDATTATIDLSGVISIDAVGNSNVTIASGNLVLETTTAGNVDVNSAADFLVDADAVVSIAGVGNSDVSIASGSLTLTTTTTGNIDLTAADDINIAAAGSDVDIDSATLTVDLTGAVSIDAVGASNLTVDSGALTLTTTTTGAIDITAADDINIAAAGSDVDIDAATLTIDMTAAVSIDAVGACNFTTDTGNLSLVTTTSGNVILTSAGGEITANDLIRPAAQAGAASADALLIGVGTTGDPATWAAAGKNGVELRMQTTATSADARGLYAQLDFAGIGVSGDALRGRGLVTAAGTAGTITGGAFTIEYNSGTVAGQAVGGRCNIVFPNTASGGGTVYGGMSEFYLGGTSFVNGLTAYALHSFSVIGANAATRNAQVLNLFEVSGVTSTSGGMYYQSTGAVPGNSDGSLRIITPDGAKWFLLFNQEAA